jgi:hypothetical protein
MSPDAALAASAIPLSKRVDLLPSGLMNYSVARSDGPPGRGLRAALRGLLLVGCYLLAAAGAAHFTESRLPFPPVPDIASRFRYFAERKNEYDTIFIGSSRFRHHIIPTEFDAETEAHGVATRSFNFGYSGMWPPESYYYLRQILALHPGRLHWVVIELMDYRFGEWEHKPLTMRSVYWHDWKHTAMVYRLMLEASLPPMEKCGELAEHAWLFLQRMTNPGRGYEWLVNRYFPSKNEEDTGWKIRAGFDPEGIEGEWNERARANLARQVEAVTESLPPQSLRPGFAVALRDLLKDLDRAGVEPVFVISPTVRPEENLVRGLPDGLAIFRFNRPAGFPRLYVPETHYDVGHLNEAGAHEFTRLLADLFAEYAAQR